VDERLRAWLAGPRAAVVADNDADAADELDQQDGWAYRHFPMRA
jgi:hypothetical protein